MDENNAEERVAALAQALREQASDVVMLLPYRLHETDCDVRAPYCLACAERRFMGGCAKGVGSYRANADDERFDAPIRCAGCDAPLHYWLNEAGIEAELGRLAAAGRQTAVRADEAYAMLRLLESAVDAASARLLERAVDAIEGAIAPQPVASPGECGDPPG